MVSLSRRLVPDADRPASRSGFVLCRGVDFFRGIGPRRNRWRRRAAILGPLLLAACAPGRDLPVLAAGPIGDYRLGPGDTVRIITYGEDPLTGEFRVNVQGAVALPLAGPIRAEGRTPRELGDAVAAALKKDEMLRKPSISVEVVAYRPIYTPFTRESGNLSG